jgi:hypothetical protein
LAASHATRPTFWWSPATCIRVAPGSLAEPVVDSTSDFAELVLAMLGIAEARKRIEQAKHRSLVRSYNSARRRFQRIAV